MTDATHNFTPATPTLADIVDRLREMNGAVKAFNTFHRLHPDDDEWTAEDWSEAERLDIERQIAVTAWECASAHCSLSAALSEALECQAIYR